ncbi:hypothetical protein EP7_004262 [Isosphaeraceae bacterium EP7]
MLELETWSYGSVSTSLLVARGALYVEQVRIDDAGRRRGTLTQNDVTQAAQALVDMGEFMRRYFDADRFLREYVDEAYEEYLAEAYPQRGLDPYEQFEIEAKGSGEYVITPSFAANYVAESAFMGYASGTVEGWPFVLCRFRDIPALDFALRVVDEVVRETEDKA